MKSLSVLTGAVLATLLLAGCEETETAQKSASTLPASAAAVPVGEGFDFYVLSLSWSPGYCRSQGDRANRQQCGSDKDFGFVVHGLWPQFTDGYPEFCPSNAPSAVSRDLRDSLFDIMPSTGLINHQWKKHGTCSGLTQRDYFDVTRQALERIAIPSSFSKRGQTESLDPDAVERAFRNANTDIPADAIAVTCDRRFLRDVRICLAKDLGSYVSCPLVDRRDCKRDTVVVPPNKGAS